ncbi:hypothetical protein ACIQYM_36240, partial [Rhodococcus erythropolis]
VGKAPTTSSTTRATRSWTDIFSVDILAFRRPITRRLYVTKEPDKYPGISTLAISLPASP